MNNSNQPSCPPRLTSYDNGVDSQTTNQYINNIQLYQRTSMHIQNGQRTSMHIQNGQRTSIQIPNSNISPPLNGLNGSIPYNTTNNNYTSLNQQNLSPQYSKMIPQQQRLSSTGDLSMQKVNSNNGSINYNMNVMNPSNNLNDAKSNMYSDFNTNFYKKNEKYTEKLGFFHIIPNLKLICKQSKLSKWALIFIVIQVIVIVVLETMLFLNYKHYFDQIKVNESDFEELDPDIKNENISLEKRNLNQMRSLLIYQVIFIIAQLFVLGLYYDSFRLSSTAQLITISGFNFIIAGYSGYQIYQNYKLFSFYEKKPKFQHIKDESEYQQIHLFVIGIFIILFFSAVVLLGMCIVLVRKFGWNIYRNVGADIQKTLILKRRYNYGIVIKFKAFFIFGIILQCIVFNNKETEFTWDEDNFLDNFLDMTKIYKFFLTYSVYILIGVYIINIICGMFAVKYESKPLMVVHIITDIIFIVYAIYIIYVIYFENIYQYILISLTGFAAIEIILILVSIYFSVIVMVDFNSVDLSENKQQLGRRLSL